MNARLCALPGCRQRNRHLPTCGTCPVDCDCHNGPHYACSVPGGCGSEGCGRAEDCTGCLPRLATEGLCCDTHVRWAAESLAEIITLAPDARAVAAGLVRHGSGGGGKPGSRSPGNDDAMDALDAVSNALTTMARDIAETRGLHFVSTAFDGHRVADPLVEASSWLTGQLDWLRHATLPNGQPCAAGVFAEIRDCASRMRAVVEGPADRRYLGPCGAPQQVEVTTFAELARGEQSFVDGLPCEGDVYARDGAPAGRCRTCGATVDTGERRAWLDAEVRSRAFTAKDIADAYGLNVKTIRSWATERQARWDHSGTLVQPHRAAKLLEHGRDRDGRSLFMVGDVLDLAAADAARREERRVERERRKNRDEGAAA